MERGIAMRDHLTSQGISAYLDTAGGMALCAQHGSRQAAAAVLVEAEAADRAWRRERAVHRAEAYPDRYASVDDAMRDIPDPLGGVPANLGGSTDDVVRLYRRIDPMGGARNLGPEPVDGADIPAPRAQGPEGRIGPADTRSPWQRET